MHHYGSWKSDSSQWNVTGILSEATGYLKSGENRNREEPFVVGADT